jgi:capsular polysaccharide biosynthesis protein
MDDRNIEVSVLDPAYLPVRAASKPRSTILAALLAVSLVLGVAAAFVSTVFDDRIYDRHDIGRLDILPVVAVIPKPPAHKIKQLPTRPT